MSSIWNVKRVQEWILITKNTHLQKIKSYYSGQFPHYIYIYVYIYIYNMYTAFATFLHSPTTSAVSDRNTTLRASDLHSVREPFLNPFNIYWPCLCRWCSHCRWCISCYTESILCYYDVVTRWNCVSLYWPFVRGIRQWPVDSLTKDQCCDVLLP